MAENKLFVGRIQLLHDLEVNWQKVANTFVPLPGEACVTLDEDNKGRVKYGDGIHTWGELPYSNDNHYDGKTIVSKNHVIQVKGYEEAEVGQVPKKASEGLEWFTPVNLIQLGDSEDIVTPTNDGRVVIPIAGEDLGLVKSSEEVGIDEDGSLRIQKVPANTLDTEGLKAVIANVIDADAISYKEDTTVKVALDVIYDKIKWKNF